MGEERISTVKNTGNCVFLMVTELYFRGHPIEANVFAASLLLDEKEMLSYIYDYNYDSEQIARVMGTDINLVALKAAQLTSKGYRLNPLESRADFLK